eukprot:m.44730 g.44730  ORF g.44730 m.44730 type:complete len:160 (+) comp13044_c0_seq1:39-518(+)
MEELQKRTCEILYGANGLVRASSLGRCRSMLEQLGPLSLRDHLHEESTPSATPSLLPEVGHAVRCVVVDVDPQRGIVCQLVGVITLNGSLTPVAEPAASWQAIVTSPSSRPRLNLDIGDVFRAAVCNIDVENKVVLLGLDSKQLHPSYLMSLSQPKAVY